MSIQMKRLFTKNDLRILQVVSNLVSLFSMSVVIEDNEDGDYNLTLNEF